MENRLKMFFFIYISTTIKLIETIFTRSSIITKDESFLQIALFDVRTESVVWEASFIFSTISATDLEDSDSLVKNDPA